jgi:hypothetical protein
VESEVKKEGKLILDISKILCKEARILRMMDLVRNLSTATCGKLNKLSVLPFLYM